MRKHLFFLKVLGLSLFLIAPILLLATVLQPTGVARGKSSAIPLSDEMTPEQELAQRVALDHPEVQAHTTGHRSEVFGVRKVLAGQYTDASSACATAPCWQVEIYNFDENTAVTAIVDVDTETVLDVLMLAGMHPGINKRLADRAMEIATNAPEVVEALGFRPTDPDMAPVPGDLLNSSCDGAHLCVAPSFNLGDRILWAVVDLTEDRLAGTAWTDVAPDRPGNATPFIPAGCPAPGDVNQDGWQLDYATTPSDGLRVYDVTYNGVSVLTSAKHVEWHADYGSSGYRDSTGCGGGGGGFPIYPYGETQVLDLTDDQGTVIGFEVVQDFRMSNWGNYCNYRYEPHFQFFADGRFRVVSGIYGKGCSTDPMYRPVVRLDVAVAGDDGDTFSFWKDGAWTTVVTETYRVPYIEQDHGPHQFTADGYGWRVDDVSGSGYYILADQGQFEASRGDAPFLYVTQHHASEGDTDLGVIGACCNDDHQQGPDQFLNGENVADENVVLWYVPQMQTDATTGDGDGYYCWTVSGDPNPETYPCFTGPVFVPFGLEQPPSAGFEVSTPAGVGETVVFTNTTTGTEPITYTWAFGDGATSTVVSPTHVYTATGTYTVSLTAMNAQGSDTVTDTVTIGAPPSAGFTHSGPAGVGKPITFTNTTTGTEPISYTWSFGDGVTSTLPSPTHHYAMSGTYTVTLAAHNAYGNDQTTDTVSVTGFPLDEFIYLPFATKP